MAAAVQHLYADDYRYPMPDVSNSAGLVIRPFIFNVALQSNPLLDTASTIKLCQIPGAMGIVLIGIVADIPQLETSSTNLVLELGDSVSASRFVTTTIMGTIGQAAGRINTESAATTGSGTANAGGVLGIFPLSYTANDDVILTVQTGPTTETTGIIRGYIMYAQYGVGPSV